MSLPVRTRLTVWYVIVLAVILLAWSGFLFLELRTDLYSGIDQSLASRAAQVVLGFQGRDEGEFKDVADAPPGIINRAEYASQLVSADGAVLESSGSVAEKPMASPAIIGKAMSGAKVFKTVRLGTTQEPYRVYAVSFVTSAGRRVIVLGTKTEPADESLERLLRLLGVSLPLALILAAGGGWLLARRALRPVARITAEASAIGIAQIDERVEVPATTDELSELALTLNRMLDRLQSGIEDKRRFIADASHELRTPLAIMRAELDVTLADEDPSRDAVAVLASSREEVVRMTRLVENLLTLARVDEGRLALLVAPVDLGELASTVVAGMEPVASERNVRVDVSGPTVIAAGDKEYLAQVVSNLLDNALKYSPDSGTVSIRTWINGAEAGLDVADEGPGIPPDLAEKVFERFFRVDEARSRERGGSGLGLAIVRDIAAAHRGSVEVMPQTEHGALLRLTLRAAEASGGAGALGPQQ